MRRIQQFFKRWRWWSTKRWQPRRKGSFARCLQLRQEEVITLHFYFYYYYNYISPLKVQIHNNLKMPNERDREDQDSLYREEEEGGES